MKPVVGVVSNFNVVKDGYFYFVQYVRAIGKPARLDDIAARQSRSSERDKRRHFRSRAYRNSRVSERALRGGSAGLFRAMRNCWSAPPKARIDSGGGFQQESSRLLS